jgi:hypothetical protein
MDTKKAAFDANEMEGRTWLLPFGKFLRWFREARGRRADPLSLWLRQGCRLTLLCLVSDGVRGIIAAEQKPPLRFEDRI